MAYEFGGNNNPTTGVLPAVTDPEQTYAELSRRDYMNFLQNYSGFEDDLIEQSQNDTSLIDAAKEDSAKAAGLASGIAQRNVSRFGGQLTGAQQQQQQRGLQRSNTLGSIQALGDARIAQRETNQRLLSDLINIGQGLNRSSMDGLASAAGMQSQREQAYRNAKAQSKAQTYSTIGGIGAAAIIALAI
jgi:hypothetical protein